MVASACPRCGALVEGARAIDIPEPTISDPNGASFDEGAIPIEIDPFGPLPADLPTIAPALSEAIAVAPPSDAVRREMRRMELEAQLANANREVLNPVGDESILVGAPSGEAIEAEASGLLDLAEPVASPVVEPATEVDASTPEPAVEAVEALEATVEAVEPEVEAVEPEVEAVETEEPAVETEEPAVEATEPEVEAVEATEPEVEADEATEPEVEADEPESAVEADPAESIESAVAPAPVEPEAPSEPWEDPELERILSMWQGQEPGKA